MHWAMQYHLVCFYKLSNLKHFRMAGFINTAHIIKLTKSSNIFVGKFQNYATLKINFFTQFKNNNNIPTPLINFFSN